MWMWFEFWMVDVALIGYPVACLYLALYAPLTVWMLRTASRGTLGCKLPWAVLAPIVVGTCEWIKGAIVFDGYPWYDAGHPLIDCKAVAQIADIGGAPMASLLVAATSGAVVDFIRWRLNPSRSAVRTRALVGVGFAIAVAASSTVYGMWRLGERRDVVTDGPCVLAVQTNLTTDNKLGWPRERQEADVEEFGRLTLSLARAQREAGQRIDLVVWPETMLPGFGLEPATTQMLVGGGWWPADRFSSLVAAIAEGVGAPLLVGSPSFVDLRPKAGEWRWSRHFNSAYLVEGSAPYARYDKVFLTPFGETMPYISNWQWLEEQLLALGARGMTFDLDASTSLVRIPLRWTTPAGVRVTTECATPICFEDTISDVVRRLVYDEAGTKRAPLIVNISNDGWFGFSDWGRAQHALTARWRCIENRAPMVRVANTGISQAFDSDGASVGEQFVAARTTGGFVATMQLDRRETLFAQGGHVLSSLMALCLLAVAADIRKLWRRPSARAQTVAILFVTSFILANGLGCGSQSNIRQPAPKSAGSSWSSWSSRPTGTDDGTPIDAAAHAKGSVPIAAPEQSTERPLDATFASPKQDLAGEARLSAVAASSPLPVSTIQTLAFEGESISSNAGDTISAPEPAVQSQSGGAQSSPQSIAPNSPQSSPQSIPRGTHATERALEILIRASMSDVPIYRAHALEGLQLHPSELAPVACRLLADANPGVRFAAAVCVGKSRVSECANLVEPLTLDPNPSVRAAALFALVRLGREVDLTPLTELVASRSPEVRSNTFLVLGELRNPSAIPLVESVVGRRLIGADQTRMRIVDLQAAEAMAKMGDYRQFDPIRAALFAPSEQTEFAALACQMIGEINDRGARGHLIGIWNGTGPLQKPIELRLIAGASLMRIGEQNQEPIFALCKVAAKDPSPTVRGQAAATLGWVGGQRALDAIAPLLQDSVAMVQLTAATAYMRASPDAGSAQISQAIEFSDR